MSNFNVDSVDSWSKQVKHKEDLRGLVGQEVEVLAIYGRKRRFTVGVDFEGNLTEVIPGKEWTWCESEYATIRVLKGNIRYMACNPYEGCGHKHRSIRSAEKCLSKIDHNHGPVYVVQIDRKGRFINDNSESSSDTR